MRWPDEKCPATGGPHHLHDLDPFASRIRTEVCCRCTYKHTVTLDVIKGDEPEECGPFLKLYQRTFTRPPDKAA